VRERIARALHSCHLKDDGNFHMHDWDNEVDAVLDAIHEPTEAMLGQAVYVIGYEHGATGVPLTDDAATQVWQNMIDGAVWVKAVTS